MHKRIKFFILKQSIIFLSLLIFVTICLFVVCAAFNKADVHIDRVEVYMQGDSMGQYIKLLQEKYTTQNKLTPEELLWLEKGKKSLDEMKRLTEKGKP